MNFISGIVAQFPYMGLFILLILGSVGFPFPEDTTLILCGFLISAELVKPVPAVLTVYVGLLIADFIIFLAGNKYGHMVINHPLFRKFISPEKLAVLEQQFVKRGVMLIVVGRHLVGLRAQIFLAAGVMKMSPLKFLAADGFSSIITMSLMIGAGYVGGNSLEIVIKNLHRVEHIAIVLFTVALAIYLIYVYVKSIKKPDGRNE